VDQFSRNLVVGGINGPGTNSLDSGTDPCLEVDTGSIFPLFQRGEFSEIKSDYSQSRVREIVERNRSGDKERRTRDETDPVPDLDRGSILPLFQL